MQNCKINNRNSKIDHMEEVTFALRSIMVFYAIENAKLFNYSKASLF